MDKVQIFQSSKPFQAKKQ